MTQATLSAKVTADIADFNKKFGEMHRTIEGVAKSPGSMAAATSSAAGSIEQSTGRWKTAFVAAGVAVAAGALKIGEAIGEWTRAAAAAAEKTEQISQQTGIAATTLEGWSVALNRVGLDSQTFAQSFKALSKDIESARSAADFSKTTFAQMGLSLKDLGSTETVIRALADRLQTMHDPAQRAQLATDLLGKAGLKLLPALMQGSAGLDALAQKSKEFGLVLDQSARTSLLKYDDSLDDLGKAWEGLTTKVAIAAAPILLKGVELAQSSITMAGKILDAIGRMVNGIQQAFARLGQIFTDVRAKTVEVAGYFKGLYDAVVGHSYIPDMVEEIGQHMKNLDVSMTAPARQAVVNTARVIEGGALTWSTAVNQSVSSMNFAWGSFTQSVGNNLAQMTQGAVNWAQVLTQIGVQVLGQFITLAIQMGTQWVLSEALRAATTQATNATIVASNAVSATASTSIWAGAATAILGFFGAVAGGFTALAVGLVAAVTAVGTFVMGVLSAIAAAMKATIFGIPVGFAILAGVVAIGAALAATGNIPGLAKGGIVTGPTLALIGEAGPEAVVPLGRKFGTPTQQTIIVSLDGHELTRYVADKLIPHLRLRGTPI